MIPTDTIRDQAAHTGVCSIRIVNGRPEAGPGRLFPGIDFERARCRVCGRRLSSEHAAKGVGPECEKREQRVKMAGGTPAPHQGKEEGDGGDA